MVLSGHLAEVPLENHKKCRTTGVLARQFPNVSQSKLYFGRIHTSNDIIWITINQSHQYYVTPITSIIILLQHIFLVRVTQYLHEPAGLVFLCFDSFLMMAPWCQNM
jgi:hypothetical protein